MAAMAFTKSSFDYISPPFSYPSSKTLQLPKIQSLQNFRAKSIRIYCSSQQIHSDKENQTNQTKKKQKPRPSFLEQVQDKWSVKTTSLREKFPWEELNSVSIEEVAEQDLLSSVAKAEENPVVNESVSSGSRIKVKLAPWVHGNQPKKSQLDSLEARNFEKNANWENNVSEELDIESGTDEKDIKLETKVSHRDEVQDNKGSSFTEGYSKNSVRLPWQSERDVGPAGGDKLRKSNAEMAEKMIPEPQLKKLRNAALRMVERIKVGSAGVTQELVDSIHEKWKVDEIVKLRFEGPPSHNMKRTHEILEHRTGGLVIWRSGSSIVLYRGISYKLPCVQSFTTRNDDIDESESSKNDNGQSFGVKSLNEATERPRNAFSNLSGAEIMDLSELNMLLDEVGPRFKDWSGREPLPVDADLLPAVVPGYRPPFRRLPYGAKLNLKNKEMTYLRRTARIMPPHFALGRNRELQGLAAAMAKLWRRSAIAKIAIKRGVQNTSNERMAEELKILTGGTLLSRNKDYIVFYRGNDFLPPRVTEVLVEAESKTAFLQDQEEQARQRAATLIHSDTKAPKRPLVAGTLSETIAATSRWGNQPSIEEREKMMRDAAVARHAALVKHLEQKLAHAKGKIKKENSNDSHRSNFSPHSSAGGVRENVLSDARDSRFLQAGKQQLSNHVGRRNSWDNKFQYHPMGNLDKDADPSYGMKHPTHSQPMLRQTAHHGQSMFAQARSSDVLADGKGFGQVHSSGSFPGGGSSMSSPLNRSVGPSSNTAPQSSPNMLQLLQKVDPSREHGAMAHFSSSEQKASSEVPESEYADGSAGHLQRNQSSASQGFGLQLGPPSQQISVKTHLLSSQGPTRAVSSSHSSHAAVEIREKSRGQMPPPHQAQSLPAPLDLRPQELKHSTSRVPGSTTNETTMHTMPGNFFSAFESASVLTHSRNQLQNPHRVGSSGQDSTNQSNSISFDEHAPHSTEKGDFGRGPLLNGAGNIPYDPALSGGKSQLSNASGPHGSVSTDRVSVKESVSASPSLMPGISLQGASSKKFANMRMNFPPPQHLFSGPYSKEPSHIPQPNQMNIIESSLSAPDRQGDQDANGGAFMSELGSSSVNSLCSVEAEELREKESTSEPAASDNVDLVQKIIDSQDGESIIKNPLEGFPSNSASMQKDIEAFGRSLKPNSFPNQSYSLLNQMWSMKNTNTDPCNMALRRMRVPDSSAAQQVPSADSRVLSFSGQDDLQRSVPFQHGGRMTPSHVAFHQDEYQTGSHIGNTNSVMHEQTQISPHMAPSWFNQYGSFKNGQMLQMYDAHRATAMKTAEQPFTPAKSTSGLHAFNSIQQVVHATADRSQIGNLGPSSIASSAATEHFSSLQMLPVNTGQQHPILKPKKRKRSTSELTPWYKEISLDLWSDKTISLVDIEWAKAVNRVTEKVKEIESVDDGPPRLKARRRLILTTQLMQQLFYPPPAAILSADAISEYESVAYSISRLALGDACSMVSCSDGDTNMPHDGKEPFPDKCKVSEKKNWYQFASAMETLMGRARKLESDFVSLDKRASVLDVIVEGQDLEKFSVFYRFAKFHGRGQFNGAESSSTDATAHSHKPFLQRYVTALPLPKNLPDRVQCLSL